MPTKRPNLTSMPSVDGTEHSKVEDDKEVQSGDYGIEVIPGTVFPIDEEIGRLVIELEAELGMTVLLLVQCSMEEGPLADLDTPVKRLFFSHLPNLPDERVALLIDSPGGQARAAYQIATMLQKQCGGFIAVIPRYAKSAATLLTLGAERIILGEHAELGPLDAQVFDRERENVMSALDEVHALERLQAFALDATDQSMFLLLQRTGKTVSSLLPFVLSYVTNVMHPLLQKIDTVHYTQSSRILKVAEEYAIRLLTRTGKAQRAAEETARHLVEHYPEHGFVIDAIEAKELGLPIVEADGNLARILQEMYLYFENSSDILIGAVREIETNEQETPTGTGAETA